MAQERNIVIESIGTYIPHRVVTTRQILESCRNPVSFPIEDLTGIRSVHVAGDGEFSIDLARKAVAECLAHSRYRPESIDLLVCGNISRCDGPGFRYSFEPSTAARLRQELGFANALVFDITNACAGMFTGIKVAEGFIKSGAARCAMVVSGEYITHLTRTAQLEIAGIRDPRLACLTLGDAGAAVILEAGPAGKAGFHRIELYTASCHSDLCIAKVTDAGHGGAVMYTQPAKLAAVAVAHAIAHSVDAVRRHGWAPDAVQHLIPHQTSRKTLADMAEGVNRLLGRAAWAETVTLDNLEERGNTATTSHFVAVMDHIQKGRIRSGDNVVFSITGSGLTVGTALLTFDDLPDRLRVASDGRAKIDPADSKLALWVVSPQVDGVTIHSVGTVPADWNGPRQTLQLATAAAERCLARSPADRADVGVLIFTGVYRTDFIYEPAVAALVAGALDLNARAQLRTDKKTLAFDLLNGGLGFLNACDVAARMIDAGHCELALVIGAEVESKTPGGCCSKPRGVAETGSAVLLGRSTRPNHGFGKFVFGYRGEHLGDFETHCAQSNGASFIQTHENGLFEQHCLECIPEAVEELLRLEGRDMADVKWILPPQRSVEFISALSRRLNVDRGRFVDVTHAGKDLFTSALAHAWQCIVDDKRVESGDIGLLIDVAPGIQVGCALYHF